MLVMTVQYLLISSSLPSQLTRCCFWFQHCCQICHAAFPSSDAVLVHLNNAHPSSMLASFVASRRGCSLLVHHDYVYRHTKSTGVGRGKHFWRCAERGCRVSAVTQGVTYDDITSIVVRASAHKHPPTPARVRLYEAMARLRQQVLTTDAPPGSIRQQLLASVDPEVAAMLPGAETMKRTMRKQRARIRKAGRNVGASSGQTTANVTDSI